jgi:hypothetical protein
MFTEEELKNIKAFEDEAEKAGGYLMPLNDEEYEKIRKEMNKYDIRAISRYKRENNLPPLFELTEKQLSQFIRH